MEMMSLLMQFIAPAEEASEYSPVIFSQAFGRDSSPYQGWPNDEQDRLWQDLYSGEKNPATSMVFM